MLPLTKTVADRSQTVCSRLHPAQKCKFMSQPVLAITYISEGQFKAKSMGTTAQPRRRKSKSDLVHLRSLPSTQPATKIGQLIWVWAEIEVGLAAGIKLKEVWEATSRDGLEMSYAQFRVYISAK